MSDKVIVDRELLRQALICCEPEANNEQQMLAYDALRTALDAPAAEPAPVQEPETSCRFPLCQTAKYQQDLEMQVAKELIGEQPRKAVKLTEAEIHNADPMPHGMSDTHRMAFGQAIETAVLAKNGLESK